MALTQKYKKFVLHDEGYELTESRMPGEPLERIRAVGIVTIDRNVFKKTDHEKAILKLAKAEEKRERH
jgi:hypothetical protein